MRTTPSTALYRQLIQCLEMRRRELSWTFERLDEVSGLQRGYAAKAFRPDTNSGRQAGWQVLQWLTDEMFPQQSFRLFLVPDVPHRLCAEATPLARIFFVLGLAGIEGYQAAKMLADAGIEFDNKGAVIADPAKAQKRRAYRRAHARSKLGNGATKHSESVAAQPLGRFG
jgi:hypothetical protein